MNCHLFVQLAYVRSLKPCPCHVYAWKAATGRSSHHHEHCSDDVTSSTGNGNAAKRGSSKFVMSEETQTPLQRVLSLPISHLQAPRARDGAIRPYSVPSSNAGRGGGEHKPKHKWRLYVALHAAMLPPLAALESAQAGSTCRTLDGLTTTNHDGHLAASRAACIWTLCTWGHGGLAFTCPAMS